MDQSSRHGQRIIELSQAATFDLIGIDNATARQWGEAQANRYAAFLQETLAQLAAEPTLGELLKKWPGYRVYTAKYRKRRSAQGHRIFFVETPGGILILRILHTAMNWPDHLGWNG